MTHLLLNDLKETANEGGDARIVVISSGMHDPELSKKRGREFPHIIFLFMKVIKELKCSHKLIEMGIKNVIKWTKML